MPLLRLTRMEQACMVRDAVLTYLHTKYPMQNITRHPLFKAVREWFMEEMQDVGPHEAAVTRR